MKPAEKPLTGQKNEWKDGEVGMSELWTVEFSLIMRDYGDCTPSIDGEMLVRGHDIFDVLEKAKDRLNTFGFDHVNIHGASRCGLEKKGETE